MRVWLLSSAWLSPPRWHNVSRVRSPKPAGYSAVQLFQKLLTSLVLLLVCYQVFFWTLKNYFPEGRISSTLPYQVESTMGLRKRLGSNRFYHHGRWGKKFKPYQWKIHKYTHTQRKKDTNTQIPKHTNTQIQLTGSNQLYHHVRWGKKLKAPLKWKIHKYTKTQKHKHTNTLIQLTGEKLKAPLKWKILTISSRHLATILARSVSFLTFTLSLFWTGQCHLAQSRFRFVKPILL